MLIETSISYKDLSRSHLGRLQVIWMQPQE